MIGNGAAGPIRCRQLSAWPSRAFPAQASAFFARSSEGFLAAARQGACLSEDVLRAAEKALLAQAAPDGAAAPRAAVLAGMPPTFPFALAAPLLGRGGRDGGAIVVFGSQEAFGAEHEAILYDLAGLADASALRRTEDEMWRARSFLKEVIDSVPDAVFVKDMQDHGRYVILNRAGEVMTGMPSNEFIGRTNAEIFQADDADRFMEHDRNAMRLGATGAFEEKVVHRPNGTVRLIRTRKVAIRAAPGEHPRYVLGVSEDVTDQRAWEARLEHIAHHDPLTDLPNRLLLNRQISAALEGLRRAGEFAALFCIDLDGFKGVNDLWGHTAGDGLLRAVGERLRGAVRAADSVGRLGGDEFVVLQAPIRHLREASSLARKIVSSVAAPFDFQGSSLRIGASVGIALAPNDAADAGSLFAKADAALYAAKREGRNRFRFADAALNADAATA